MNLVNLTYYSVKTYRASKGGVQFSGWVDAVTFYRASNPLPQLVYSMLWAIPIGLAVRDYVSGTGQDGFHVTPKRIADIRSRSADD